MGMVDLGSSFATGYLGISCHAASLARFTSVFCVRLLLEFSGKEGARGRVPASAIHLRVGIMHVVSLS
jgi:hypothetical protein